MPRPVIHVYHESAQYLVDLVQRASPDRTVIGLCTREELTAALPAIEILFAPTPPREGWAPARRLRLIQLLGVGADTLLPSPDLPPTVEIAGVRGEFAADVAEHALALMLAHARGLTEAAEQQRHRRWHSTPRPTLAGETVVIVGHGSIGQRLARAARALEMDVRPVSRTGADPGVAPVSRLAEVVGDARYVVLCVPLTPQTRGLFNTAMLARMRPDAFLVNVARGGVVDEMALVAALGAGRLAGAALDVLEVEPLPPESPLWTTRNLVITPHIAGLGERYIERCVDALVANVEALESGGPPRGLVNRDVGY